MATVYDGSKTITPPDTDSKYRTVAINGDGTIVAAASIIAREGMGRVDILKLSEDETFEPFGLPIVDSDIASIYTLGWSVALDAAGRRIAVGVPGVNRSNSGAIHIYDYDTETNTWVREFRDVIADNGIDWFGISISISASGNTVIAGASLASGNTGRVAVYDFVDQDWHLTQLISGPHANSYFGRHTALSGNGLVMAVCAPSDTTPGPSCRMYHRQSTVAQFTLRATLSDDTFSITELPFKPSSSVSLSETGDLLVLGDSSFESQRGAVIIAMWQNGEEYAKMSEIVGAAATDQFGYDVSVSAAGDVLAVSSRAAPGDNAEENAGDVKVYNISDSTDPQLMGNRVSGRYAGARFGTTVSLSHDGSAFAAAEDNSFLSSGSILHFRALSEPPVFLWTQNGRAQVVSNICFRGGVPILTDKRGWVPIQDLRPGSDTVSGGAKILLVSRTFQTHNRIVRCEPFKYMQVTNKNANDCVSCNPLPVLFFSENHRVLYQSRMVPAGHLVALNISGFTSAQFDNHTEPLFNVLLDNGGVLHLPGGIVAESLSPLNPQARAFRQRPAHE